MTEMNQTPTDGSITLFRNLIADLQFCKLSDINCAISAPWLRNPQKAYVMAYCI